MVHRLRQGPARAPPATHRASCSGNRPYGEFSDRRRAVVTGPLRACRRRDTCDERRRNFRRRRGRFCAQQHALEGGCPAHSADPCRQPRFDPGGGVTLQVWSQKRLSKESHIFSGGTISYVPDRSSGSGCGQQVFRVTATLATSSEADDSGLLDAYLTHYRRSVFGRCITYAATVHGSLTLAT